MEQKKRLYPMKFKPETVEHPWGKETFVIADLGMVDTAVSEGWLAGNSISDIMETYIERISGEQVYGYYGRQFPVMVSLLEINGVMPALCHPDDEAAAQRYDALGRRTFWHILEAGPDARIRLGFSKEISAQELYERCLNGTVRDALESFSPEAGDSVHIEPGTVYSAEGKMRILSISESSAIAFTLYDPSDISEESHIAEALDLIRRDKSDGSGIIRRSSPAFEHETLLSSPEFKVSRISASSPVAITSGQSFTVCICIGGALAIREHPSGDAAAADVLMKKGDVVLIPADLERFFLVPTERDTEVLEISAGERDDIDSYINPDTEPFLEGEDYEGLEDEDLN